MQIQFWPFSLTVYFYIYIYIYIYAYACMHSKSLSCVRLFVMPWTVARQAPASMGFSRQE